METYDSQQKSFLLMELGIMMPYNLNTFKIMRN